MADGVVYFGAYNGAIYALDAATGAKLWSFYLYGGQGQSNPAVVDGVVYTVDEESRIYALNAASACKNLGILYPMQVKFSSIKSCGYEQCRLCRE